MGYDDFSGDTVSDDGGVELGAAESAASAGVVYSAPDEVEGAAYPVDAATEGVCLY